MGRQLRRVPMDFDWPLNKTWKGFLNPHYKEDSVKCPFCSGSGLSKEGQALQNRWYGWGDMEPFGKFIPKNPFSPEHPAIVAFATRNCKNSTFSPTDDPEDIAIEAKRLADLFNGQRSHHLEEVDVDALLKANRLWDFTHRIVEGKGWKKIPKAEFKKPTPEQVNIWSIQGFGHDSINCSVVCRAEAKRLKVPYLCGCCKGNGTLWRSPKHEKMCDKWKETPPPKGKGYQLWETVSEGSPISPVFETPEELARYLVANPWNSTDHCSYETWMKFICGDGWAPSMIMVNGKVMSGVEAVTEM